MGRPVRAGEGRGLREFLNRPSVASGRALVPAMLVLFVCDVIGGFIALATTDADTWNEAWGFETTSTVPLPVGAVQLALAWFAARSNRVRVGRTAAVTLSAFCLLSVLFGLFDGDLISNVEDDGFLSAGVLWAGVLLLATAVVGLLAAARARQLREVGA